MSLILPSTQLVAELTALGWQRVIGVMDRQVLCPSADWLTKFGAFLARRAQNYQGETFDCEDFARWAVVEATKARLRNRSAEPSGHAVMFCIVRIALLESVLGTEGSGTHHALCLVRTNEPDPKEAYRLMEPQNGTHATLESLGDAVAERDLVIV